jgi:hypothetical protein
VGVAADVPGKYDAVIGGTGFVFLDALAPNIPFRSHRAIYGYTPTFVERQNVSNSYGDNAQDFFLTARQRDWSLGEQQRFVRNNQDGRYYAGSNVEVSTAGQVTLTQQTPSLSFAAAVRAGCQDDSNGDRSSVIVASATNLYRVRVDGSITDLGAHGLGATPSKFAACNDAESTYISTTSAGTVGVRRWGGAVFTTFSASGCDSLTFVNNTLYGWRASNGDLVQYDTAGTLTSIFTWKNAAGGSAASSTNIQTPILHPYGGKVLICFPYAQEGSELWVYDGVSPSRLAVLPPNFTATGIDVLYGVAYISGNFYKSVSTTNFNGRPAVLFFDGSQLGLLWQANTYGSTSISSTNEGIASGPTLGINNSRLIFTDDTTNMILAYNPVSGGVSGIGSYSAGGSDAMMFSTGSMVVMTRNQTTGYYLPHATTYNTSGYVQSSQIDFDSSLTKVFRGVTVEFDAATDGDGGSVDVAYQLNGAGGSYTSLATGVTSGTENLFATNTTGHSVSVKITLNKGTSTAGPTLKNMSVRGAPQLRAFRMREYILDLTGAAPDEPRRLRDDSPNPATPHDDAAAVVALMTAALPVSVTDRLGTFTGVIEPDKSEIYEMHSQQERPVKSGSFVVKLTIREV